MVILIAAISFWGTAYGLGRFAFPSPDPYVHILAVQVYLGIAAFTSILLNSAIVQIRQTSAALRQNERRYLDVLNFVRQIAIQVNCSANITFTNDFLLQMSGWQKEDLHGKNWLDALFPPEEREEGERMFNDVIAHKWLPRSFQRFSADSLR